jgi:hypothetical protein
VSHGLSGTNQESLISKGFLGYEMRHGLKENGTGISLRLLAIPAGFEPATHGVEIRYSMLIGRNFHEKRDALANIFANKLLDTEEERVAQKVSCFRFYPTFQPSSHLPVTARYSPVRISRPVP